MDLIEFFSNDHFARMAGIRLTEVSVGHAVAEMPITDVVLNASGYCQGGAIFTLADLAFAAAVNTHERLTVSVNSNIAFLRAVSEGKLTATADELFDHHRLPFAQVRITNEADELVALFSSSGYRRSEK